MKKIFFIIVFIIGLNIGPTSFAGNLNIGGYEQFHPNQVTGNQIGAGWGHKSMTYGMMNLMSGMTTQAAKIIRSGKASKEMNTRRISTALLPVHRPIIGPLALLHLQHR